MERLTYKDENGVNRFKCDLHADTEEVICYIKQLIYNLARYEDTEEELRGMLAELENVVDGDDAETYTTGYRSGYRNGRIELLRYILHVPDGVCGGADRG